MTDSFLARVLALPSEPIGGNLRNPLPNCPEPITYFTSNLVSYYFKLKYFFGCQGTIAANALLLLVRSRSYSALFPT